VQFQVFRKADDKAKQLIVDGDVSQSAVDVLIEIASFTHLREMADYSEMLEVFGLENFRAIIDASTELKKGLDPNEPNEFHSAITLAQEAKLEHYQREIAARARWG